MKDSNKIAVIVAEVALIIIVLLFAGRSILNYLNTADKYESTVTAREEVYAPTPVPDNTEQAITPEQEVSQSEEAESAEKVTEPDQGKEAESTEEEKTENTKSEDTERLKAESTESKVRQLRFRNKKLLNQHYEKHGTDMGFKSAAEYEQAASAAALNPEALHKTEKEDGDDVYYITATNEFVIVSTDGYIRTYFKPDSGIKYYNKQ